MNPTGESVRIAAGGAQTVPRRASHRLIAVLPPPHLQNARLKTRVWSLSDGDSMLISHHYRCVFLRTEKTGSTSVLHAMQGLCANRARESGAPALPIADWERGRRGALRRVFPSAFGLWFHSNARQVRAHLGEERFASYFKFSIERNPWDRQVSLYAHRQKKRGRTDLSHFDRDIRSPVWRALHHSRLDNWAVYAIDDAPVVDFMIKYESLREDFQEVLRRIGAEGKVQLEHRNSSGRSASYREHYTDASKSLVADWHAREIKAFGYSF